MKKAILLIDGSNFYFKLKDLKTHQLANFDYSKFSMLVSPKYPLIQKCYYIGRVRQDGTEKSKKLFDNQQRLFGHLRKAGFTYSLGDLFKNDGVFHEKGVDVQIAVDMVVAAYEKRCDHIYVVSSDTDLLPAVRIAQAKGVIVEYVGFSHKPTIAMIKTCKESTLLKKEDVEKCIEKI